MVERSFVRTLVAVFLSIALLAFIAVPVPVDEKGDPVLPDIALEQVGLYRLEVALLVFYGGLLLVTPAFSGLARGRLPTEISTRGAKFPEDTSESAEATLMAFKQLEQTTNRLADDLVRANREIKRLKGDDK